jgi:hypothetical protein
MIGKIAVIERNVSLHANGLRDSVRLGLNLAQTHIGSVHRCLGKVFGPKELDRRLIEDSGCLSLIPNVERYIVDTNWVALVVGDLTSMDIAEIDGQEVGALKLVQVPLGRVGAPLHLFRRSLSLTRGSPGGAESAAYEYDAEDGGDRLNRADEHKATPPVGRVLFGLEGFGCVVLLLGALGIGVRIFERAGDALGAAFDGSRWAWARLVAYGLPGWLLC